MPAGENSIKIDGFLKVPDIPGESERDGHEKQMEVHGLRFAMQAPHDPNSLSRRGKVALDMIVFVKYYDIGSPYLKKALFDNTLMDEVEFSARRTIEGETSDYLVITLTNASVMKYEMRPGVDQPDLIEEEVGFAYHAIKFVYNKDHEIEMSVRTGM